MNNKHYDNLVMVAEYYGTEVQTLKTLEKLGELVKVLAEELGGKPTQLEATNAVASVYNMLDQYCILMDMEDMVQNAAEYEMEQEAKELMESAE